MILNKDISMGVNHVYSLVIRECAIKTEKSIKTGLVPGKWEDAKKKPNI